MTKKCPKCKNYQEVNVIKETKSEELVDGIGYMWLECKVCGYQFNHWNADQKTLKEFFGEYYEIYK